MALFLLGCTSDVRSSEFNRILKQEGYFLKMESDLESITFDVNKNILSFPSDELNNTLYSKYDTDFILRIVEIEDDEVTLFIQMVQEIRETYGSFLTHYEIQKNGSQLILAKKQQWSIEKDGEVVQSLRSGYSSKDKIFAVFNKEELDNFRENDKLIMNIHGLYHYKYSDDKYR